MCDVFVIYLNIQIHTQYPIIYSTVERHFFCKPSTRKFRYMRFENFTIIIGYAFHNQYSSAGTSPLLRSATISNVTVPILILISKFNVKVQYNVIRLNSTIPLIPHFLLFRAHDNCYRPTSLFPSRVVSFNKSYSSVKVNNFVPFDGPKQLPLRVCSADYFLISYSFCGDIKCWRFHGIKW